MHRRHLLIAGGSLLALSACASNGMPVSGGTPTATLQADAAVARALLPAQTPRAELLQPWTGPYEGVPPWDRVTPAKLKEALLEAIELRRAEYAAIANNPEPPTFANTMVAQQMAGQPMQRAGALYGVMTSNIGSAEYQAVDRELMFFEEELRTDLVRLAAAEGTVMHEPALVSKAITRLVFAMGAMAMDLPPEKDPELIEQLSEMVRLIITGSRALSRGGAR